MKVLFGILVIVGLFPYYYLFGKWVGEKHIILNRWESKTHYSNHKIALALYGGIWFLIIYLLEQVGIVIFPN